MNPTNVKTEFQNLGIGSRFFVCIGDFYESTYIKIKDIKVAERNRNAICMSGYGKGELVYFRNNTVVYVNPFDF